MQSGSHLPQCTQPVRVLRDPYRAVSTAPALTSPPLTSPPAGEGTTPLHLKLHPPPTPPPPVKESPSRFLEKSAWETDDSSFPTAAGGLPSGGAGTETENLGSGPDSAVGGWEAGNSLLSENTSLRLQPGKAVAPGRGWKHSFSRSLAAGSKSKRQQGPAGSAPGTSPEGVGV